MEIREQMEDGSRPFKQPATATTTTTYKFPTFRRGVHDFGLLSCFIPSRRRFRDKLFLLPSDSSAPGSPTSVDGASSADDVDDDEFFSDEDVAQQLLTTDSSSSSLESSTVEITTATTTLPDACDVNGESSSQLVIHDQSTDGAGQEATEESFVFSPPALLADNAVAQTPSFRTLSNPMLSTFSYDCSGDALAIAAPIKGSSLALSWISCAASRSTSSSSLRAHSYGQPPNVAASPPHQTSSRSVWLPLPALPPDVASPKQISDGACAASWSSSYELRSASPGVTPTSRLSMSASTSGLVGSENRGLPLPPPSVATQLVPGLHYFEFEELRDATGTFAPECCLEQGTFGAVYRALVKPATGCVVTTTRESLDPSKQGVAVAVVRLAANDKLTLKEWKSDVQVLAQLPADRNVGVIQGYCAHEDAMTRIPERLLVFEQSPCGTLHDYLRGRNHSNASLQQRQLDWPLRISIALGAARALLYIHDRAPVQVLYRDFTAASVLILDQDYTPKLAGYGLSVTSWPTSLDNKASFTMVMKISKAHAKTNVYSFGVVLLEILTGKDSRAPPSGLYCDAHSFVQWALPYLKDEPKLLHILDPRLTATQCPSKPALKLAGLAAQCLKKKPTQRPSMATVVDTLKSLAPDQNVGGRSVRAAPDHSKRRATSTPFGGISFHDAEHRSKFVGQYLSVQGAFPGRLYTT